ncbi:MAG TPA: glucoamylase family protein [Terriglobales bacterium]
MPQDTHLEMVNKEAERLPQIFSASELPAIGAQGESLARELAWVPGTLSSKYFQNRINRLGFLLRPLFVSLSSLEKGISGSDDFNWLRDNVRLLYSELGSIHEQIKTLPRLPHVQNSQGEILPRAAALAESYLAAVAYEFSEQTFTEFVSAFQQKTALNMKELLTIPLAIKVILLDRLGERGHQLLSDLNGTYGIGICVRSLREASHTSWKTLLEPLILFDLVLREDPAGAYGRMDYESRELYRNEIVEIAERCDRGEIGVAKEALALARQAANWNSGDERITARQSHIGYYLLGEGAPLLQQRVGFNPKPGRKLLTLLRRNPDEFYLPSILLMSLIILSAILLLLTPRYTPIGLILFSMVVLLLPSSQTAVQLINYLTTSLLRAQIIPKLDFSGGIPDDCAALVAIPALLLNEDQIHRLVDNLEVRYLGNRDRNLHFMLLTDLPDSRERPNENDPRVDMCADLIRGLSEKYAKDGTGSFLMLHRHRVYNPRERVWMGWERKRGKLLDLNQLLRSQYDSFPVKIGDLSVFEHARFVITLDADTELPRGSAQRMVGAMAHPLNRAIIDPQKNIVVAGYGILQPRVGVSVQSAGVSRLANIYSGQTGFDIYTRAISDVYQDLYGEGIFAGKGIYEVETVHKVLDRRFPRNALLSHDLIEGAYARAGLASDIEVIEDYPSHYSAYNRRKHRWLRGDWQIAEWLFPRVPDETGKRVQNPISVISQWKILDNLRRSLVEPATLLLFVLGWLVLPGSALLWTIATVGILFVPVWFQFAFNLVRAAVEKKKEIARDATDTLSSANFGVLLTLIFLVHQTLVSLDAVIRTMVRRIYTRQRMLEWETAAEVELGRNKRAPVDVYLDWMPAIALVLGLLVFWIRPRALAAAVPILVLWASSKLVALWLNRPPGPVRNEVSQKDEKFLRGSALRTWRYFAEFSNEEHHWLIPDNVQEEPLKVAARVSPTNVGLLLNARQVACEFGYLTVPEFAAQTLRTLATIEKLPRYKGHLLNWYDTNTLEPLTPLFVSSVDSGNLVASLWTLQQGCTERLRRPVIENNVLDGFTDYLRILHDLHALPRKPVSIAEHHLKSSSAQWLIEPAQHIRFAELLKIPRVASSSSGHHGEIEWFATSAARLLDAVRQTISSYVPWLLPEFASLRQDATIGLNASYEHPVLQRLPELIERLEMRLIAAMNATSLAGERKESYQRLLDLLPQASTHVLKLIADLRKIIATADSIAKEMDFNFLLDKRRKLLSVGFDAGAEQLHSACYDLLASESRIATFIGIAKDEIPQETWFLLGRAHTLDRGRPVLLSWTGTMFEYLMPALWMRSYPNTLLERSRDAVVRLQRMYAAAKHVPWGISESAYSKTDEAGNYQYHAFGISRVALRKDDEVESLVISPYSTFLALSVDASESIRNLREMAHQGWIGPYGFYESVDFNPVRHTWRHRNEIVRCWMAHHEGMSLLAIANFLRDDVVQRWFHGDPRVQATELLLHEKPVSYVRPQLSGYGTAAA